MLGGETTAVSSGSNAFELSARNLSNEERRTFEVGDSFFNQNWVIAPASTTARDGLGPTFNVLSCSSCHSHDGRAKPPENDDDPEPGLLLRLSVPGPDGPVDEPIYGEQLQDRAISACFPKAVSASAMKRSPVSTRTGLRTPCGNLLTRWQTQPLARCART